MTEEFRLREPWLKLRICGLDFCVELCDETVKVCGEILSEAKAKLAMVRCKKLSSRVGEREICQFFKVSIDRLLGSGSVDKIFGERRQELLDLSDLMCYIVSKIREKFLVQDKDSK